MARQPKSYLDAGRPMYFYDGGLKGNTCKWLDGSRDLIEFDAAGNIVVVRSVWSPAMGNRRDA